MPDRRSTRRTSAQRARMQAPAAVAATPPPQEFSAFVRHVRALTNYRAEIRALVETELERRALPGAADEPAARAPRTTRQAYLAAAKTWHRAASDRLADLRSGRIGSSREGQPLPPEQQAEAARLARRLVVRLSNNSLRIATLEGAERRWHVAAKAAREGIQLRRSEEQFSAARVRPDARLHLTLARTTFMLEGNSPRVRSELRQAVEESPRSKGLPYWLARYEVMAGRYSAAHDAIRNARDYAPVRQTILPLLEPESTNAPWLSWPCNFYSYRYSLAQDDQLRGMQDVLAALSNNPEIEVTWTAFGIPASAIAQLKERAVDAATALRSLILWNQANLDMTRSQYAKAARNYNSCQRAIVEYFAARLDLTLPVPPDESGSDTTSSDQLENALDRLAQELIRYNAPSRQIWTYFRERYMAITLEELHTHDWRRPQVVPLAYEFAKPLPDYGESTDFATALARLLTQMSILKSLQTSGTKVEEKIDAPLLAIALVFCPIAIAEANRLRRSFDPALSQCRHLLRRHSQFKILSEVVEKPFVKILKAQILLDKADGQYKARALAHTPATNPDGSLKYQGLEAAETYQGVLVNFEDQGQYVNRVNAGMAAMSAELSGLLQHTFHPIAVRESSGPGTLPPLSSVERRAFGLVGKRLTIETIAARQGEYPEPDRRVRPHESLLKFEPPGGTGAPPLETNPIIYALIVQARARLLQMESGLNYLGYSDDYVPPWRFQFVLDRSRYFAEHAKNAQREYLNFLGNAEREEFQELTAAQTVEMEKSNIRLETARVQQVSLEVESARAAEELARLTAANSEQRFEEYRDFDAEADRIAGTGVLGMLSGNLVSILPDPFSDLAGGVVDFFTGGGFSRQIDRRIASLQRDYEEFSLELAAVEAAQAAVVAGRQVAVAQAGLLVAGMQRAAAVLRHEFAVQNLTFLRNRTLNSELWYRLAAAIRSVADTYLRYAIEMAFLAEQAYEFEADKRMDVIRFDYDVSDLGDMLAGDFLLRDLDTLEQDLIVGQRIRQQQIRYVLSLAREFPSALQELRETGRVIFSLRLEQIERRFPGLFNVRVAAVDVLPMALMDATRFNLELTHLGTGQVRLKADPSAPPDPVAADWITGIEAEWAVRLRITGPETAVFSGLTRQDQALPGTFASSQRGAFEGVAGAGAWRVDLSMKENRIVSDSLADLLVTFTLSGYYDATLREAIDHAPRVPMGTTSWLSAHHLFPDGFYQFNRAGVMEWRATADSLALQGQLGELRNVAVVCSPSQRRAELGRLMCVYPIEFEVDGAGNIQLTRELPLLSLTASGLTLNATLNTPAGSIVTFDFGDGSGLTDSTALPHSYARPGRYEVLVRIAANGRLTEYRAAVVVSRQHAVLPPCIAIPELQTSLVDGQIVLQPSLQATAEALSVLWRIDGIEPDPGSGPTTFTLTPGRYVLRLTAVRSLSGRFYSQQRYDPTAVLALEALRLSTNRTFDVTTGAETTTNLNAFGQHVFGSGSLSPADRWTFEMPLDDNPAAVSVTSTDVTQHDLSEIGDIFLALEYLIKE